MSESKDTVENEIKNLKVLVGKLTQTNKSLKDIILSLIEAHLDIKSKKERRGYLLGLQQQTYNLR